MASVYGLPPVLSGDGFVAVPPHNVGAQAGPVVPSMMLNAGNGLGWAAGSGIMAVPAELGVKMYLSADEQLTGMAWPRIDTVGWFGSVLHSMNVPSELLLTPAGVSPVAWMFTVMPPTRQVALVTVAVPWPSPGLADAVAGTPSHGSVVVDGTTVVGGAVVVVGFFYLLAVDLAAAEAFGGAEAAMPVPPDVAPAADDWLSSVAGSTVTGLAARVSTWLALSSWRMN